MEETLRGTSTRKPGAAESEPAVVVAVEAAVVEAAVSQLGSPQTPRASQTIHPLLHPPSH